MLSPGTNLATSSDRAPWRAKKASVLRTQESGSSEMRHNHPITRPPRRRPTSYHSTSDKSDAATHTPTTAAECSSPVRARAPPASRIGSAGSGSPTCSAKTKRKRTR